MATIQKRTVQEKEILENVVSYFREPEKLASLAKLDSGYAMRGMKIILATITVASIAQHFKQDYPVLSFNDIVFVLKGIYDNTGPDDVLERQLCLFRS
jgi:hypothetical protein